jgi:glycosyltransferase involved in cell wall biosynthesis
MKLAFISMTLQYSWGGADALWTQAADTAIHQGDQVWLAIPAKKVGHPRIAGLLDQGAGLYLRTGHASRPTPRMRLREIAGSLVGRQSLTAALDRFRPDAVVLCQGGTFDFLVEPVLCDWLEHRHVPCLVICQANADHAGVSAADRDYALGFLSAARAVVFVSRHNHRLAERQLGATLSRALVIQNPIARTFPLLPWPPGPDLALAAVARLESFDKGLDALIPALAGALHDEPGWRIDFFGEGPDRGYLENLARIHGIASSVHFAGFAQDVAAVWRDHHLLLLPSRIEGCSLAMMEAMSCGRPVLATAVGGVDEWIEHDVNGFVCSSTQVDELVPALRHAWARRADWPAMGRRAAEQARLLVDPAPGLKLLQSLA